MPGFQRILLKLSGEALAGGAPFGIDAERVKSLAREVADVTAAGVQVGVVVGGGNIFRPAHRTNRAGCVPDSHARAAAAGRIGWQRHGGEA